MLFLSSFLTHTAGVSNLIIISQLNHFTFVSGYSCCIVISLPKFPVFSSARQVKSSVLISQPAPNVDIISCTFSDMQLVFEMWRHLWHFLRSLWHFPLSYVISESASTRYSSKLLMVNSYSYIISHLSDFLHIFYPPQRLSTKAVLNYLFFDRCFQKRTPQEYIVSANKYP